MQIISELAALTILTLASIWPTLATKEFAQSGPWQRITATTITMTICVIFLFSISRDPVVVYILPIFLISHSVILIDMVSRRIPNLITLYLAIIQTVSIFLRAIFEQSTSHLIAIPIAAMTFALFLFMNVISRNQFGMGDVKLSYSLALGVGSISTSLVLCAFTVAFLIGGIFAFGLLLLQKGTLKTSFAFGPFMLMGTWICLLSHGL